MRLDWNGEAEVPEVAADRIRVGVISGQPGKSAGTGCGGRGMGGISPIDEEGHETAARQGEGIGEPPREGGAVWALAPAVLDGAEGDAVPGGETQADLEVRVAHHPGEEPGGWASVEAEGVNATGRRVGCDDLKVDPVVQGEKGIPGSPLWVRSAEDRGSAKALRDKCHAGVEIGRAQDEVVDVRGKGRHWHNEQWTIINDQ